MQDRTARIGLPVQGFQDREAGIRHQVQNGIARMDRQNRTGRTILPLQDWHVRTERTARTGLLGPGCQNRTASKGLPAQGCQYRTARIIQPG